MQGMLGGDGVEGRYGEVGSSMRGMARLRRIAASSWAGVKLGARELGAHAV